MRRTSAPFKGVGFFDEDRLVVWPLGGFAVVDFQNGEIVAAHLEGSKLVYGARVVVAAPVRVVVVSKPWERKAYAVEFVDSTGRRFTVTGTARQIAKWLSMDAYVFKRALAYPVVRAALEAFEACGRVGEARSE